MKELVIIWDDGSKNIYTYPDRGAAEQAERNMRMAFGNQITWSGIR